MSYMTCCVLGQEKNKMHGYHCSARRTQHPKCILNETFSLMGGVGEAPESPFQAAICSGRGCGSLDAGIG